MDARPLIQQPSFPPPPTPPHISSISNPQFPPLQQIPQPQPHPQVAPQPLPQLPPAIISPSDHGAPEAQVSKRRRTSGPGSRGVNNLTPEQLAKKRANDREAQRAIRERTKGQIEALEKKIQDLTSQKPYQELQDVLRQKELVEAENADIKRRLAAIQSLVQPILAPTTINRTFTTASEQPFSVLMGQAGPPSLPTTQTTTVTPTMSTNDAAAVLSQNLPVPAPGFDPASVRSSASTASNYTASPSTIKHTPPRADFPPQPNGLSPGSALPRHPSNPASFPVRGQDDKLALDYLMASRNSSRESNHLSDRTPSSSASRVLPMDTVCQTPSSSSPTYRLEGPVCSMPIRNIPPTCPLDGLLLDFLADQRRQALEGIPISEIIGPPYPCFTSLINPTRRLYSHSLSKMFTDMLATFPDISTLPEQVAILYVFPSPFSPPYIQQSSPLSLTSLPLIDPPNDPGQSS